MECEIVYIGDDSVKDVHHIGVEYHGVHYSVIFGKYVNGGFCAIPNFRVGCELSDFTDTLWNTESLDRALKNEKAATAIAAAIAKFG